MRLIDGDALKKSIAHHRVTDSLGYITFDREFVYEAVKADMFKLAIIAPTIEAEPVRHGRWARKEKNLVYWHECSECGERPLKSNGYYCQSTYCPFCGAKMDGGDEQR